MWQHHDKQMKELNKIYSEISKQTKNRLQEIFKVLNLSYDNFYNIADKKVKSMIDVKIVEWKDKKLLKGYFGVLANNIYNKTRVKNSEILELLIYSAYIEEQSKLDEYENQIIYDDMNYYYMKGQEEVNESLPKNKRKEILTLTDILFLSLLAMNDSSGYDLNIYKQIVIKNNTDKLYRQAIININQQKELDIDDVEFQNIIDRQVDNKIKINGDKIFGAFDHKLIELDNKAKIEGIKLLDKKGKIKFIAIEDNVTTKMCQSLNNQVFNINDWNEFYRYSKSNDRIVKYRCYGLIPGLNSPPIDDGFHWCRSYIQYIKYSNYNLKERKRIFKDKISSYNWNGVSKIAILQNIARANMVVKDFPMLQNKINQINLTSGQQYFMAITPLQNSYMLDINKDLFISVKSARTNYEKMVKLGQAPKSTTYKDILTHELGHAVNFEILKIKYKKDNKLISEDWNNCYTSTEIVNRALKNIGIKNFDEKINELKKISEYSLENSEETIAEAFCDYYSNRGDASLISKEIVKIVKEWF